MSIGSLHIRGSVLPTAIVATMVIAVGMLGLLMLWDQEQMSVLHKTRLRQARADVESAWTLYRLHPDDTCLLDAAGFRLYDSLPRSSVYVEVVPWGVYELVKITSGDSLIRTCRIAGVEPEADKTLYCSDNNVALTVAGDSRLHGMLALPQNGLAYGRMGTEYYRGEPVPQNAVVRSEQSLPYPDEMAVKRVRQLLLREYAAEPIISDSIAIPFLSDTVLYLRSDENDLMSCCLSGPVVVFGEEIRIDSTCRLRNVVVCAKKVSVGAGASVSVQIIARDTVIVEPRAILQYPSGVYSQSYAELGDRAVVNGYVIVLATVEHVPQTANYRQARSSRVRGLVYVDGVAQLQGIVTGYACLKSAVYFSAQGYYKNMLYDVTLLENPVTAVPMWIVDGHSHRKEALCVE